MFFFLVHVCVLMIWLRSPSWKKLFSQWEHQWGFSPHLALDFAEAEKWQNHLSKSLSKKRLKIRKLWIFEHAIKHTQIGNSVTFLSSSPPIYPELKKLKIYIFSLKKIINLTFTLNVIINYRWNFDCTQSKMTPPPLSDFTNQNRSNFSNSSLIVIN